MIFQVWTSFQLELLGPRCNKNLVFTGCIGKKMLFLACRSVRNSILKFLVPVLETQTWLPSEKTPPNFEIWVPELVLFQGLEMESRCSQ